MHAHTVVELSIGMFAMVESLDRFNELHVHMHACYMLKFPSGCECEVNGVYQ